LPDVQAFYDRAYSGNWFESQMLDTGQYFGLKEDGRLVSVAGVHVYSREYKVALRKAPPQAACLMRPLSAGPAFSSRAAGRAPRPRATAAAPAAAPFRISRRLIDPAPS
jgi:hypothetical protein